MTVSPSNPPLSRCRHRVARLLFVGLIIGQPALAGEPALTLHVDVFTGQNLPEGGGVGEGFGFDGRHLFVSNSREEGRELWVSDGTPGGTRLLADICRGRCSSSPSNFSASSTRFYFSADDGVHGRELWMLRAGADTPELLVDINPGAEGSNPSQVGLVPIGSNFIVRMVVATRHDVGRELFRIEGDTVRLDTDLLPGPASSSPALPVFFGDRTPLTTMRDSVNQIIPVILSYPPTFQPPASLSALAGFPAPTGDFTLTGTPFPVRDGKVILRRRGNIGFDDQLWLAHPGNAGSQLLRQGDISELIAVGRRVYFTDTFERRLRVADGTVSVPVGPPGSRKLTPFDGGIAFIGQHTSPTDLEVFVSQGTPETTSLLAEVVPGSGGLSGDTSIDVLTEARDHSRMYLTRSVTREIWALDSLGAQRIVSFAASGSIVSGGRAGFGPSLLFSGPGGEPFITDGELNDARKLAEVRSDFGHSLPEPLGTVQGQLLTKAIVNSDGLAQQLLVPANAPGPLTALGPFSLFNPLRLGNRLVAELFGNQLFVTDGTFDGSVIIDTTRIVLAPGCFSYHGNSIRTLTEFRVDGVLSAGVFQSDGTDAGSFNVIELIDADFAFPGCHQLNRAFAAIGDALYFTGTLQTKENADYELLRFDGANMIEQVADLRIGTSSVPQHFAALDDHVLFSADDGLHGRELWISDGTAQGTQLLLDIVPGAGSGQPEHLQRIGDRIAFSARTSAEGRELWSTDGTVAGTQRLRDIAPGPASSIPDVQDAIGNIISTKRRFFDTNATHGLFLATAPTGSPDSGCPVFITDGTPAGTRCAQNRDTPLPIRPLSPATAARFTAGGDIVFFSADDLTGEEVRVLHDGELIDIPGGDLMPGPAGSGVGLGGNEQTYDALVVDGHVAFFAANNGVNGYELHRLDLSGLRDAIFTHGFEQ